MLNKAATTDKLADNLKTKIGAEGDATSLENVKKALDIIVVGNQMHVTDNNNPGLPDWRITNTSMAASQVHANAETDGAGHLMFTNYEADSAIGSVPEAEISAWGYGTDPYRGWYTEEKQVYDYKTQYYKEHGTWPTKEEIAKALGINVRWVQTGHYIIVTGKYEYVGLGYNTSKENYLRNTAVSNLDSNRAMDVIDGKEVYENSYTIDDYRALFDAYYNEVMSALTNAQNDLTAKQDALKALQATDGLTSEEKQAITDAQAAVEAAQEKYDALNTTLSEAVDAQSLAAHNELVAQIGVDKAVEAKTEAANAEADAQTALNDAKTAAEAENSTVSEKKSVVMEQQKRLDDAESKVSQKQMEADQAETSVTVAMESANTKAAAQAGAVEKAKEAVVEATKKLETAKQTTADSQSTAEKSAAAVQDAERVAAEKKAATETAEAALASAKLALEEAKQHYQDVFNS